MNNYQNDYDVNTLYSHVIIAANTPAQRQYKEDVRISKNDTIWTWLFGSGIPYRKEMND